MSGEAVGKYGDAGAKNEGEENVRAASKLTGVKQAVAAWDGVADGHGGAGRGEADKCPIAAACEEKDGKALENGAKHIRSHVFQGRPDDEDRDHGDAQLKEGDLRRWPGVCADAGCNCVGQHCSTPCPLHPAELSGRAH